MSDLINANPNCRIVPATQGVLIIELKESTECSAAEGRRLLYLPINLAPPPSFPSRTQTTELSTANHRIIGEIQF